MSVLMVMHWPDLTIDHYENLRKTVNWEGNVPKGLKFHTFAYDNGAHIVDVWDNAENFKSFVEKRLMPEVQKAGIKTQPKVDIYPVHAVFPPGLNHK
jgi:hypothetical protein